MSIFFFSVTVNIHDVSSWLWFHNMKLILQQTAHNHLFYILLPENRSQYFFLQVHIAAFPISISVTAERISSQLMALNSLKSNIWTFFLWAASIQHPRKIDTESLEVLCARLWDRGLSLVSYHRFPATLLDCFIFLFISVLHLWG